MLMGGNAPAVIHLQVKCRITKDLNARSLKFHCEPLVGNGRAGDAAAQVFQSSPLIIY
jgi:hypothetical protein